jgi:pantoate--beta-alanine ligase
LLFPVEIVGHPTVREADGLALSSRNAYLSPADRVRALSIPRSLSEAVRRFAAGERGARALRVIVERALGDAGLVADYVSIADPERISPFADSATIGAADRALLAVAVFAGRARLIDNVVLGEDSPPIVA